MERKLIIPGGAGYLGRHVARWFGQRGWQVVILSRRPGAVDGAGTVAIWDGKSKGDWAGELDGANVVLNVAGRTVNCRYTKRNRDEIYASRLDSTRIIGQAIARAARPPAVWLNASSATIYRHADDQPMDEASGEIGSGFSVDVCQKWEAAFFDAETPQTRKVALRSAMVMGPGADGVFGAFYGLVRKRLGGTLGRGTQYVSWIHLDDFCRAIEFLIERPEIDGPANLSAPGALPNRRFMGELRQAAGVRLGLPATRWMLEIGAFVLRTETELLLKSRWVSPGKLLAAGFRFEFPEWAMAAKELVERERRAAEGTVSTTMAVR